MKKSIIVISTFLLFICLVALIIYIKQMKISPTGYVLDEKTLIHDIKLLGRDEVIVKHVNPLKYSNGVIEVFTQNKDDFSKPLEVRQAFRILLYLRERHLPIEIIAVKVYIEKKWAIDGDIYALVSHDEFTKLLSEIDTTVHLENDTLVEILSKKWIIYNKYKRLDLQ